MTRHGIKIALSMPLIRGESGTRHRRRRDDTRQVRYSTTKPLKEIDAFPGLVESRKMKLPCYVARVLVRGDAALRVSVVLSWDRVCHIENCPQHHRRGEERRLRTWVKPCLGDELHYTTQTKETRSASVA